MSAVQVTTGKSTTVTVMVLEVSIRPTEHPMVVITVQKIESPLDKDEEEYTGLLRPVGDPFTYH